MPSDKAFFGGVIYIDLRGYTKIVEEKILKNIADLIYSYQEVVVKEIKKDFDNTEIAAIEYMGDGILIILKELNNEIRKNNSDFFLKIYNNSKKIKSMVFEILELKKKEYTNLNSLDFGIGISASDIYQKNVFNKNTNKERALFFGTSLNRAAKIGDVMNVKKKHIGIDKIMYDKFLHRYIKDENMIKNTNPIVHMHLKY